MKKAALFLLVLLGPVVCRARTYYVNAELGSDFAFDGTSPTPGPGLPAEQESEELPDEVIARLNPDTGEVESLQVLFFSTCLLRTDLFELPVNAVLRLMGTGAIEREGPGNLYHKLGASYASNLPSKKVYRETTQRIVRATHWKEQQNG